MTIRYAIACAMLSMPGAAWAQGAVTVEIVAAGEVSVPAQRFRMSATLTAKGDSEDAAKAALATVRAKMVATLAAKGVREAQPDASPGGNSIMALFASVTGRSKPTVSMDPFGDAENPDAKPQSIASETIQFDAPTRAAAADARKAVEAAEGTVAEEVIGLIDDYAGASRRAKADALVKARAQADAYGETLGLRKAAITRISEKQDIIGGTLGFVSQLIGMFAPKSGADSNNVTVRESLTVEFSLTK